MPLRGLLIAQFFGAFNDNAWKLIVALLGMRAAGARVGFSGPAYEAAAQLETTLAFVVFTLPLMLVSFPAGVLADRISKRSVIVLLKGLEVALMAAATLVLISDPLGGVPALVLLGLMGAHGVLFSPAKYGILPEILPHHLLSAGNGLLEMWSFAAIIAGTVAGGLILGQAGEGTWKVGAVLTAFSVLGFIASLSVPRVPPSRSEGGLATTVQGAWSAMRADRVLGFAVHSFGYMATLWLAANHGLGVVFHPNPLDAAAIGTSSSATP